MISLTFLYNKRTIGRSVMERIFPLLRGSICLLLIASVLSVQGQKAMKSIASRPILISHPSQPWVFWYWMQASVSREGITADLEAMKASGIGGAYLMPIKGVTNPPLLQPPVEQLSPAFWEMVKFAMQEADRLGLQLGMHFCDGFAIGGGPWITPELSMQKVVWTESFIEGGQTNPILLSQPEGYKNYYKDIAVLAFPSPKGTNQSTYTIVPKVTTSKGLPAQFLVEKGNKESYKSEDSCWIQYSFNQPFTCRSLTIKTSGNNYQAQRLLIEVSDDNLNFRSLGRLQPPRHGWQDTDADVTHDLVPVTAKYFRFIYDKTGSEPGAEDLDAAKWKQVFKITGIELSGEPRINQFEGKNGEVWRVSKTTTKQQVADSLCVALNSIIDVTNLMDSNGHLNWKAPSGKWTILRMGYTSTGHTNATGGGGIGLECDKFNPVAVKLQFDNWFGQAINKTGAALASRVLKIFHVDSWECGSQNWSPVFRSEFKKRRGYELLNFLPALAGIPVESADVSERFLYDLRKTIVELLQDNFYKVVRDLAHAKGCAFTAESVAPTMTGDGMLHYSKTDIPMGEFWLNSPTHDKPNDMLDAISAAHIYGKRIIQSESFTTLKMTWNEYPGMLKIIQDRNYALGINRLVYHVFSHNPWMDRKPGMTLDGVGLYFQRDQTWWKPGKAWVDYATRCQTVLQKGLPVVDIAVFTGEEIPRRAILPDRLVPVLPGIFGVEKVKEERLRLANANEPLTEGPVGVWHAANMALPENWIDPLRGYQYDSFNEDALIRLAKVKNGRIELPGGASYGMLVIPGQHPMNPDPTKMSVAVASRLLQLIKEGAVVLMMDKPDHTPGLEHWLKSQDSLQRIISTLWGGRDSLHRMTDYPIGKGRLIIGPYTDSDFNALGLQRDVIVKDAATGKQTKSISWAHRRDSLSDIYFISNQLNELQTVQVSVHASGRVPELYDAVTGETHLAADWSSVKGRTILPLTLQPAQSVFIILRKRTDQKSGYSKQVEPIKSFPVKNAWKVSFDKHNGGPTAPVLTDTLFDWSKQSDSAIRYYSGTAVYTNSYQWGLDDRRKRIWLSLGRVANIATIKVNGIDCGTAWTWPYRVDITRALHSGNNTFNISVTNTWANRLMGDQLLTPAKRITNTTAPFHLQGKPLNEAGLLGPVTISVSSLDDLK